MLPVRKTIAYNSPVRHNAYWRILLLASKALFMVPFSQDNFFIGREDVIHQIKERRKAATSHTRTALVGLGGVGSVSTLIFFVEIALNRF